MHTARTRSISPPLSWQTVEITRRGGRLQIVHGGRLVAEHDELAGKYQVHLRPEHGPGAIAQTTRRGRGAVFPDRAGREAPPDVEIRDLAIYETLAAGAGLA